MDPRFLDHFERPRRAGDLADAAARVEVTNPVCGDRLLLAARLEPDGGVALAWRAFGCSATLAAASALAELAHGCAPAALAALDRDAVDRALGGLPRLKRHGADLAVDALRAALRALAAPAPQPPTEVTS